MNEDVKFDTDGVRACAGDQWRRVAAHRPSLIGRSSRAPAWPRRLVHSTVKNNSTRL